MVEQNHVKEELLYSKTGRKGVGLNRGLCLIAERFMAFLSLLWKQLSGRTANSALQALKARQR